MVEGRQPSLSELLLRDLGRRSRRFGEFTVDFTLNTAMTALGGLSNFVNRNSRADEHPTDMTPRFSRDEDHGMPTEQPTTAAPDAHYRDEVAPFEEAIDRGLEDAARRDAKSRFPIALPKSLEDEWYRRV